MILLFKLIIINTIWTLGLRIATNEGMVFYWVRQWAEKKEDNGSRWVEPLILCHFCMPSFHSLFAYSFAYGMGIINHWSWGLLVILPLVIMGSSLLNGLIWGTHNLIDAATHYFTNGEKLMYMDIRDRKDRHNAKRKSNG